MKLSQADEKCRYYQNLVIQNSMNGRPVNAYSAQKEHWEAENKNGRFIINDVRYAQEYPNSFLDIWYPNRDRHQKRPVVINFHGGGFIFGSKKMVDPLALQALDGDLFVEGFLKENYIFVNADYALAPEYRFPVQLQQVDQVVRFVLEQADTYGFDIENISMTGGSAGADLTQIYALAISQPEYAAKLGLQPTIGADGLRCVLINEAALHMDVNSADENICAMLQTWLGVEDAKDSEISSLVDVSRFITDTYPPAFLIASNHEPFFLADVLAMKETLDRCNLPCEAYYVDSSVALLKHGFVNQLHDDPYANACYKQMIAFLKRYTQRAS